MKILPIKKILSFFAILMLISCYHSGSHKVIDKKPKKAILGEDYTIEKYRSKCTSGQITFQIVDDAGKTPDVPFYIEYNGMFFFDNPIVTLDRENLFRFATIDPVVDLEPCGVGTQT